MIVFPLAECRDTQTCLRYWQSTGRAGGRLSEAEVSLALSTAWGEFEGALGLDDLQGASAHGILALWCYDRAWNLLNKKRRHKKIIPVEDLSQWKRLVIPQAEGRLDASDEPGGQDADPRQ